MSQSTSSTAKTDSDPTRTYGLKSVLAFFAVCVVLVFCFSLVEQQWKQPDPKPPDVAKSGPTGSETPPIQSPSPTGQVNSDPGHPVARENLPIESDREPLRKAKSRQMQEDRNRAQVAEVRTRRAQVRSELAKLRTRLAAWNQRLDQLLENDPGRRLAADPSHLELIATFTREKPLTPAQIAGWEEQLRLRFRSIPEKAHPDDGLLAVPDDSLPKLQEITSKVDQAAAGLARRNAAVDALLAESAQQDLEPEGPSLRTVLQNHFDQAAIEKERELAEAVRRVREKSYQQRLDERTQAEQELAQARLEAERKRRELELALAQSKAKAEQQKAQDALEDANRTEEKRQAEREAQLKQQQREARFQAALPQINKYLTPLITPGERQLQGGRWVYVDKKAPLSLSGIRAKGGLKQNDLGYRRLYEICGAPENDRPNGPFREWNNLGIHDHEVPLVRKVQSLLEEHGDLMVEKGLLAP